MKSIIYILENRPFIVESVARKPMKQTNKNGVQQEAGFQEAHSEVKIGKISVFYLVSVAATDAKIIN